MHFDPRTTATVLAALRYWQRWQDTLDHTAEHDIASDGGTLAPLTAQEIDTLCEAINCAPRKAVTVVMDGGVIQNVLSADPVLAGRPWQLIDYDIECSDEDGHRDIVQSDGTTARAFVGGGTIEHDTNPPTEA